MRFQLVASLALLQLHSFVAAATTITGSDATVGTNGNHGTSTSSSGHNSHGQKPHGDHGTSMSGSQGGASLDKGSNKKSKGLPRMENLETFSGVHLSPVSGGVVSTIPIMPDSATLQQRAVSSAVALPDSDFPLDDDCFSPFTMGNIPKRCYNMGTLDVPDPVPANCAETHTCADYGRSISDESSAATEKRAIPSKLLESLKDCPIIDRRGDFLVRKCTPAGSQSEMNLGTNGFSIPVTEDQNSELTLDKKRAPIVNEAWSRSDGGESYI